MYTYIHTVGGDPLRERDVPVEGVLRAHIKLVEHLNGNVRAHTRARGRSEEADDGAVSRRKHFGAELELANHL